jgi:initiation factor 1A
MYINCKMSSKKLNKKSGKGGTHGKKSDFIDKKRPLILKDDDHEYGLVTKKLGCGRFSIRLPLREKEVIGKLRKALTKGFNKAQNRVDVDGIVLVSLRDFQDDVVDIIHAYNDAEIRLLKKNEQIFGDVAASISKKDEVDDSIPFDFESI